MSTLKPDKSLVICRHVPPHAMPELSAICSSGRVPSMAAASSRTANLIICVAMILMALTALSPGVLPGPRPSGGNSAPSFMYSPSTLSACAYSSRMCGLSQFVQPANCCTCCFVFSGAKSRTACALSSSPETPSRPTTRPKRLPLETKTLALSTPNEKPLTIETSKKASSDTAWSSTCQLASGCLFRISSRRQS